MVRHLTQPHPVQPVVRDALGTLRFRGNAVVCALLDRSGLDLDQVLALEEFSQEDQVQFAQLLGYPVEDARFDAIRTILPKPVTLKKKRYQPHPMQPIVQDDHGTIRFRANAVVRSLLDRDTERSRRFPKFPARSDGGLNWIATQEFLPEDEEQLAQLIGYSISGYHELSYVSDESAAQASAIAREILPEAGGCRDAGCPYHGGPLGGRQ
jgi:hypothetical protein